VRSHFGQHLVQQLDYAEHRAPPVVGKAEVVRQAVQGFHDVLRLGEREVQPDHAGEPGVLGRDPGAHVARLVVDRGAGSLPWNISATVRRCVCP